MNWIVRVAARARKELKKFPYKDHHRIIEVMTSMAINPYQGDIEKMAGEINSWRRRAGAYRIFYEINASEKIIEIFRIERRTSSTY